MLLARVDVALRIGRDAADGPRRCYQLTVSAEHPMALAGLAELLDAAGATEADPLLVYFFVPFLTYGKCRRPQAVEFTKAGGAGSKATNAAKADKAAALLRRVRQFVMTLRLSPAGAAL